jgi:nucleotide-binding universal stress UspA family protein
MALAVADREARLLELRSVLTPAEATGVGVTVTLAEGDVVKQILARAREWPADLLVMETQGHRPTRGWALGSVTEKVLRDAPCPVLAVPRPSAEGPQPPARFSRILCSIDLSQGSRLAMAWALALQHAFSAELLLVHSLEWFPAEGRDLGRCSVPEYGLDLTQAAHEQLRRALPHGASAKTIVTSGQPHREILRLAREHAVDLIVLGVHSRRALDHTLPGSTVAHVLREAMAPVLAVRPEPG